MIKQILFVLAVVLSGTAVAQEESVHGFSGDTLVWRGELNTTNTYGDAPLGGAIYIGGNISSIQMDDFPPALSFPTGTIILLFDKQAFFLRENALEFAGQYNNESVFHVTSSSDVEIWDVGMLDSIMIPFGYEKVEVRIMGNQFEIYVQR